MPKHGFFEGIWTFRHYDKNGKLLYEQTKRNAFADEGEYLLLDTFFRATGTPSGFYLRAAYDVIQVTDSLVDIQGEPTTNGYVAKTIERTSVGFPTLALDAGHYMLTSKHITWTAAGGDIGPINTLFLATTSDDSGKLICSVPLLYEQTILDGNSGEAWITIKFL